MAPTVKITLIQFQPEPLSPEANFEYATNQIRSVAAQGAHIAVLPEYHLTSWEPAHPDFIASCNESTTYLARYQDLARELNIHIVPGTIINPISVPSHLNASPTTTTTELQNIAHFIEATTGTILCSYQKRNLWHVERGVLTAGTHNTHKTFDISIPNSAGEATTVRVGLLICWDLAFPESFRPLTVDHGAQLIIIPAYWHISQIDNRALREVNSRSEAAFLDAVTVARAFENSCAVALCNAWGHSQVAMPVLGTLEGSKLGVDEEGMRIVGVDLDVLRVGEEHYRVRRDLKEIRDSSGKVSNGEER